MECSQHPSDDRVGNLDPQSVVPMEVAQSAEPTTKSRVLVEEHDESLAPKRERENDPRPAAGQDWDHQGTQLGTQAATVAATDTCRDADSNVSNWVSLHRAVHVTFWVMLSTPQEEVHPTTPLAEPPPSSKAWSETDAMLLGSIV